MTTKETTIDPRVLTPGSIMRWKDGSTHVLKERKADDSGWWLDGGGGITDRVWETGEWSVVQKAGVAHTRVYKYPLSLHSGEQTVEMPHGAKIVHVHEQDERPCLWAEVNTTAPMKQRTFMVFATGEDVWIGGQHVGTIHVGWTVWHIYDYTLRRSFDA